VDLPGGMALTTFLPIRLIRVESIVGGIRPQTMTQERSDPGLLFQSAIQRILPHRYPFLLVDRITEFVPGERIVGLKNFTANDEASQGHLASGSLVPSGILLEMVTQLGAILVLERPEMAGKAAVILQIPWARILDCVRPGDTLRVVAEVVRLRDNFGELQGAVYKEEKLVGEGRMRFGIAEKSSLQLTAVSPR